MAEEWVLLKSRMNQSVRLNFFEQQGSKTLVEKHLPAHGRIKVKAATLTPQVESLIASKKIRSYKA